MTAIRIAADVIQAFAFVWSRDGSYLYNETHDGVLLHECLAGQARLAGFRVWLSRRAVCRCRGRSRLTPESNSQWDICSGSFATDRFFFQAVRIVVARRLRTVSAEEERFEAKKVRARLS